MIHSELCSACGSPLQFGVGLVNLNFKAFYENCLRLSDKTLQSCITIIHDIICSTEF